MNYFLALIFWICLPNANGGTDPLLKKDLFAKPEEIKAGWLGYLKSGKRITKYANIPMLIINQSGGICAKVICVPKKPSNWNAKFAGKTASEKIAISKTLIQGIHSHTIGANVFKIFALVAVIPEKAGVPKEGNKLYQPVFPCKISVYSNQNADWTPILERFVKDQSAYQNLQYELAQAY